MTTMTEAGAYLTRQPKPRRFQVFFNGQPRNPHGWRFTISRGHNETFRRYYHWHLQIGPLCIRRWRRLNQ